METLIALDVGTTGVKAALLDRTGAILAEEYSGYPMIVDGERVEQDPGEWWRATVTVLAGVARKTAGNGVTAIGLTGQMQDLIALGSDGTLGNAILYSDTRARPQAKAVEQAIGDVELERVTGDLQDATSLLAKLLWLRDADPARFAKTRRVLLGAHDYIAWKLTGAEAADYTTASTTGLLDIRAGAYALPFLSTLGIPATLLPPLVAVDHVDGGLCDEAARLVGLPRGTPVYHGAGDAGSTTVGAGAGVPGVLSCYLGTSGWLAGTAGGGLVDPRTGIFNLRHPDPTALIHVGPLLLAAGNVDWVMDGVGGLDGPDRHARFTAEAGRAPAGSGGVLFLPHLVGERSPFRDPDARGAFVGLSRTTARPHLYRSVLEGVAFAMRSIRDVMDPSGEGTRRIGLSGGGARSTLWPQIFADVFGCEVSVTDRAEHAGLLGVLVTTGRALGWQKEWLPPRGAAAEEKVYRPEDRARGVYDRLYEVFRGLYPALRGSFAGLARIETEDRA